MRNLRTRTNIRFRMLLISHNFYHRYPLSLRNFEDLPHERGADASHEIVRLWWNRFGPMSQLKTTEVEVSRRTNTQIGGRNWTRYL